MRDPEIAGPAKAGGTVLVVDSDPEIATLIETYLMRRGFRVYKAYNSEDALAIAARVKPQVITLDVILEDGDGFELIQRFKSNPDTASIPVVVLSIVCDEGRSCRFGAANYLEKPIDQTQAPRHRGQPGGCRRLPARARGRRRPLGGVAARPKRCGAGASRWPRPTTAPRRSRRWRSGCPM